MNMLFDVISQAYANILMFLMGDARLETSTVMTAVCGGSIFLIFAVAWLFRPRPAAPPPPPGTTVIVQQSTPAWLMVFVMVMMFGLLLIVFVR